ncbi:hypothetical protein A9K55_002009 [Cordyceps militaris]|uniref:Uncharacterized protein n=1 Tax=Cordyceps militaris TaxID=73501 RepID=A0A2H4SS52_CORMI|nr:hypothetical protein A9K55_002009 [Cordyceps militaris]
MKRDEEGATEGFVRQGTAHTDNNASWAAPAATSSSLVDHDTSASRPLSLLRTLLAPPGGALYAPVRAAVVADGHGVAAGLVTAAVLANHVRRVLAPWLGQFLWWHPVQAMRLARGAPHVFIAQQLRSAATLAPASRWLLQTGALALLRRGVLADVLSRGGGSRDATAACLTDAGRILYLALCLMRIEYAYAEACWVASWAYAVCVRAATAERHWCSTPLLTGEDSAEDAPRQWRGMLLVASLLLWWLWRVVVRPLRRHGVTGVALSGVPVVVGLVGVGTAHIIRYANKYFIWLEMSEMLLTWVWLILGLGVVVVWRLCD